MKKDIKIAVACHKPYWMCCDGMYHYVEAGADRHAAPLPGMERDNAGENISGKNETFCELTVLYYAWKNWDCSHFGLSHYRRYFAESRSGDKKERILTGQKLDKLMDTADVILPKKRHYWIETNYSQYIHVHHKEDLDTTRSILERMYPEYLAAYDASMKRTSGHRFNMFVMKKDIMDAYCTWLFSILFQLEKELDISDYDPVSRRVFGYVSERLMDVWIDTNHISYREIPVVNLENQHWFKKITGFLKRKIRGGNH